MINASSQSGNPWEKVRIYIIRMSSAVVVICFLREGLDEMYGSVIVIDSSSPF